MKREAASKRTSWLTCSIIALSAAFFLCRYVFFELHRMKQWTFILFASGIIIIIIAAVFKSRSLMLLTPIGYIGGFTIGMLFGIDGTDPGGGRTNNTWIIWTVCFLIAIFAGVMWELLNKYMKKRNRKKLS